LGTKNADVRVEEPREFSQRINLPFENFLLLSRALTHRSYINEHPEAIEDNERLEFLGDAILDFVVGAWLYNHFPEMAEGQLTRFRAALVNTETLGEFGEKINLGQAIMLGRGEEENGGRERMAMLCGTFEALIGALYLDQDIPAVEKFMEQFLEPASKLILENHQDQDPKSLLQEWAQAQSFQIPFYRVIKEDGPDHDKTFTIEVSINGNIIGRGQGRSKQEASKSAASAALENTHTFEI
jgi:ribonuclease-3